MFTVYVGLVVIGYEHDFLIHHYFNEHPVGSIVEVKANNLWHAGRYLFPQFRLPKGRTRLVVDSANASFGKFTLDGREYIATEFLCIARSSKIAAEGWVDDTVSRFIKYNRHWNKLVESSTQPENDEVYWDSARTGKSPQQCLIDALSDR